MCPVKSPYPQIKKMRCPYCGWVRTVAMDVLDGKGEPAGKGGGSAKSSGDETREIAEKIRAKQAERQLTTLTAWIDVPGCPHCDRVYQFNVETSNTRP